MKEGDGKDMKRNILGFGLLLCLLGLWGCSAQESEVVQIGLEANGGRAASGEMPGGEMPSGEMPSGEMPDGEAPSGSMPGGETAAEGEGTAADGAVQEAQAAGEAVIGQVESIVGNRVVLLLGEQGENGAFSAGTETAEYLLPVGMAIGTGDFTSVTEGMVLQLTVDTSEGSEVITAVRILSR